MDIQISSNFERLLFDLYGRDADKITKLHDDLQHKGGFTLSDAVRQSFQGVFMADYANDAETKSTIKEIYDTTGRLIDPHTAVGICVGKKLGLDKSGVPLVNLACAAPAKFPDFVHSAVGIHPALPHHLSDLFDRPERQSVIENDINIVKEMLLQA